jgi:hypothetical protein
MRNIDIIRWKHIRKEWINYVKVRTWINDRTVRIQELISMHLGNARFICNAYTTENINSKQRCIYLVEIK